MPRLQFLLRIELDDDSRVSCAEWQHTFGLTVLTADATDYEWTRATDAHVIVNGIRLPGSRTPKCQEVYCRVMVL